MEIKKLLKEIGEFNSFGEKITVVAATKTRTLPEINAAIAEGIRHIGENSAQELMQKFGHVSGAKLHFIGHLQTNKVKYLIGKTFLIQSLDRDDLAAEIDSRSQKSGIVTDTLMQINIGDQPTKGGYPPSEAKAVFLRLREYKNIKIKGLMAMLPFTDDRELLKKLCLQMRNLYDNLKKIEPQLSHLSMGMSGDYKIALECGSNMVRLGSALFGQRK